MDIEDSMYSSTADLLSLRYAPLSGVGGHCGGSGSLLLSSPWPIPSTPSPPSSLSSVSSSVSASSPSSVSSSSGSCNLQTINEAALLSLSNNSPVSGHDLQVTSPLPSGGGGGGLLEDSLSHHQHNSTATSVGGGTTVIFTTTANGTSGALTLVDPISSPALEVAHATGKSILRVHEQEHGDLIHFSTSSSTTPATSTSSSSIANHVNGNGNENRASAATTATTTTTLLEAASVLDPGCKAVGGGDFGGNSDNNNVVTDTDGNLFPTLILTAAGGEGGDTVIPMRLYTSLTSGSATGAALNGSAILTTGDPMGAEGDNATCILMTTTRQGDQDDGGSDLRHVLLSGVHHHHQDQGHGDTFTLAGFTEQLRGAGGEHASTNLGTTTILMDECFSSVKGQGDVFVGGTTKLKDILMNGHNNHNNNNHLNNNGHQLLSRVNGNGNESYILRELEGSHNAPSSSTTNTIYDNRVNNGQGSHEFVIPKEEEMEELKLHSVEDPNVYGDDMIPIYQDAGSSHIMVSGGGGGATANGDLGIFNNGSILAIAPSSVSNLTTLTTNSVIWSNSGGIVEAVGVGENGGGNMVHFVDGSNDSSPFLMKEDIGDLDGIEDDDLLEAKEEMDADLYGDGEDVEGEPGAKGELKCKFCGFVCCSKSSLGIHERRHTGERPFACKYCGRLFNSAQCCKHHERLHTGDKPFQCSYCGKKYAVSTRLKRHERVHTREEPYKCTECNKTFRWFDAFRDHRNTHTGVPLYLCSVCGKTFTSYLKFYYHERGHLMKKERDRDRLAKQRVASGLPASNTPWPSRRVHISRRSKRPITHTIDILKSLQRNSSAAVISSLSQQAQQLSQLLTAGTITTGGGAKKSGGGGGSKGQSKKKASKKQQQQQANNNDVPCA